LDNRYFINEKTDFSGAVQIIQPIGSGMADQINSQDGLYHVILNGLKDGRPIQETNTTEAGISFDERETSINNLPNSFPGKLTLLLHHRFNFFNGDPSKAPTIIPCELIEKNGSALKFVILQYINHWKLSPEFRSWIENHIIFCNTLVDRIVPGFPKETIQAIQSQLGFEDNLVVTAEPFMLWVIEGSEKVREALRLDQVDLQVKFVSDLTPYRTRKVRILNGAHTAMVPVAYLYGLRTVRESVENPVIWNFIKRVIYKEIIPTLDLPPSELKQFADDVLERFRNPYIKHELSSIALNSISKFKTRVLPSIMEYISRHKKLPENLLFSLAALIRFYKGDFNGEKLPVQDSPDIIDFFNAVWKQTDLHEIAREVLNNENLWGVNLNELPGVTESVARSLKQLDEGNWALMPS
jgi:tagaturonate reductase